MPYTPEPVVAASRFAATSDAATPSGGIGSTTLVTGAGRLLRQHRRRRDGLVEGVCRGLVAAHVEPERRIGIGHQRAVCSDAEDPAVHPEHEVVEGPRVTAG